MALVAKKPCSFCGRQFFIGDEIPEELVADAGRQEKLGVLSIVNDMAGAPDSQSGAFLTREQADAMAEEAAIHAVLEAEQEYRQKQEELQQRIAELEEGTAFSQAESVEAVAGAYDGKIIIAVNGDDERGIAVPATPEEIKRVFAIMQMNAEEGAKAVAEVVEENVLILLHAADSRKAIKTAAKKQADSLYSGMEPEETGGSKEGAGADEGDGA